MNNRLIIYTDSILSADVNTFEAAAERLKKDYQTKSPKDSVKILFVKSGKEIVGAINKYSNGQLASLDIVSHGNQGGIHIARKLAKSVKAGIVQRRAHVNWRASSDRPQDESQAEFIEESMHGLYTDWAAKKGVSYYYNQSFDESSDIAYLADITFSSFSKNAFVEFHGCRTAEMIPGLNTVFKDNFAKQFADNLGSDAIVVGHILNSNPNKNPNGKQSDYRHGLVRSYKGGKLVNDQVDRRKLKFANSSTPE
ncbi:MAG TPA: hypothetical protein VL995_14640 [Cellvibrio sp.]|nr:hypothetical protein [Cellvibrio sp.]